MLEKEACLFWGPPGAHPFGGGVQEASPGSGAEACESTVVEVGLVGWEGVS